MKEIIAVLRTVRLAYWIILALVSVTAFSATYYRMTNAACYSGNVLGRSCYRGYFTNGVDHGGTFVLPVISNNQALPATSINSADALYNLLRAAYGSSSAQKRTGASFIYNTMMQNTAPGTGKTISNTEWINLRDSLRGLDQAGKIDWSSNVSVSINSYWQGTDEGFANDGKLDDDAYYENFKNETGITVRDYNNNVIYQILRRCANPVGKPGKLPPPRNYVLTPHVDTVSPTQVEANSKMTVTSSVDNIGQANSQATKWEITQINVNPGKQAPHETNAGANANAPCQAGGGSATGNYFQDGNSTCKNVKKGSGIFNLGSPAQNLKPTASAIDIGDLPVGTRVCFALSVQPHSNTDSRWMHSRPVCTTVGKKPKVQIWGGDIAVRGMIETSTSVKDVGGTKVFGSWVEYGVFSIGMNNRFASASGLNGQANNAQSAWSKLTFANIDDTGTASYGNYATATNFRPAPGIAAYFAGLPGKQPVGATSVDLASLTFATGHTPVVRTAGNLTITRSDIPAGRSVVIVATGTVTIADQITYTDGALNSVRDIPQVVIIANSINIRSNVRQVDAWLVASGTINTCSNFSGNLTSNKCGESLAVNGPVVTGRLLLNRTAGSGTGAQSGDPAERFNLRPDAFLWAQLQATGNDKAQTVYSTELPPRF
jgi:hypothetical protein